MAYSRTGRPNGRPPKPSRKPTRGPLKASPARVAEDVPEVPSFVALGELGLRTFEYLWRRLPYLEERKSDAALVALVASKVEEWKRLTDELEALGSTFYVAPNGQLTAHPLVKQRAEAEVRLTAWLSALGASPSDRSRLGPEVLASDPVKTLEDYRNRWAASRAALRGPVAG